MKKRLSAFALVLVLAFSVLYTAQAESFWSFDWLTSAPTYTPVELPPLDNLAIIDISPTGDYLAFDSQNLGMIRNGVFTPFTRNESRSVQDDYGCLEFWERDNWLGYADDPIWSPDGRWVILTSYYDSWSCNNSLFPVLIDTQTNEYFLLYSAPFAKHSLTDMVILSAAAFSQDSQQLYGILYDSHVTTERDSSWPILYRWDLNTMERTEIEIRLSEKILETFEEPLTDKYGPDNWESQAMEALNQDYLVLLGPAYLLSDGSIVCTAQQFCFDYDQRILLARLSFDAQGDHAILELMPAQQSLYEWYGIVAAGNRVVTLNQSFSTAVNSAPYFCTDALTDQGKCFYFLCGHPDYQDPTSQLPTIHVLQDTAESIVNTSAREWVQYGLKIWDFVLSPDGESLVIRARNQASSMDYLLHVRLDDLQVTTLLMTEDLGLLPRSAAGTYTAPNNHFIWSECGTILMTAGEKTYAFRLD